MKIFKSAKYKKLARMNPAQQSDLNFKVNAGNIAKNLQGIANQLVSDFSQTPLNFNSIKSSLTNIDGTIRQLNSLYMGHMRG